MLHIEYPETMPCDFRCFDFPLYAYVKQVIHWGGAIFLYQEHDLNKTAVSKGS